MLENNLRKLVVTITDQTRSDEGDGYVRENFYEQVFEIFIENRQDFVREIANFLNKPPMKIEQRDLSGNMITFDKRTS